VASVLFLGKRHYTNRDALTERYGRIFQLPWHWSKAGISTRLWLLDYHGGQVERRRDDSLDILNTPLKHPAWVLEWLNRVGSFRTAGRPQVVVASGDSYIGMLGFALARSIGARFVFDVYDKYDEFGGFRRPFGFDAFQYLLERADVRLFASRALLDSLGASGGSNLLVPNGIDAERFRPLDKQVSRSALGLSADARFVGYFGSMEPDRGVTDLVDAVHQLRAQGSIVELLLGGKLSAEVDANQSGVRYVGNVPFEMVPAMLASCDALAVPYRRSAFMDAGASNKIAEAMACARPLVATMTPNLTANFPEQVTALAGRLAEPGDASDLARVLALQLDHPVLSPMPTGMTWFDIAEATARSLHLAAGLSVPV
jgi:glycosyltransferase involved in cell wall biosynthesis